MRAQVRAATQGDRWVVDGNYRFTADITWARATCIIWLDYPFALTFWRTLKRTLRRSLTREVIFSGNVESFWRSFFTRDSIIWWMLTQHANYHRKYAAEMRKAAATPSPVWLQLRHPREAPSLLQRLKTAAGAGDGVQASKRVQRLGPY